MSITRSAKKRKITHTTPDLKSCSVMNKWLHQGDKNSHAVMQFLDYKEIAKVSSVSKRFSFTAKIEMESRLYQQVKKFVFQANDSRQGKALHKALNQFQEKLLQDRSLFSLCRTLNAPLRSYLVSVKDRIHIENLTEQFEHLLQPVKLRSLFSKKVQKILSEIESKLNELFHNYVSIIRINTPRFNERVAQFLQRSANANYKKMHDHCEISTFQMAVMSAPASVVEQMLKAGANANYAAYHKHPAKDINGTMSVLMLASAHNRISVVKLLLKYDAKVNEYFVAEKPDHQPKQTAIFFAARDDFAEVGKILINHGAILTFEADHLGTPLQLANSRHANEFADVVLTHCSQFVNRR